eukprot:492507-Hanusia_phi.AAC.1
MRVGRIERKGREEDQGERKGNMLHMEQDVQLLADPLHHGPNSSRSPNFAFLCHLQEGDKLGTNLVVTGWVGREGDRGRERWGPVGWRETKRKRRRMRSNRNVVREITVGSIGEASSDVRQVVKVPTQPQLDSNTASAGLLPSSHPSSPPPGPARRLPEVEFPDADATPDDRRW